jgi:hypothetical protein
MCDDESFSRGVVRIITLISFSHSPWLQLITPKTSAEPHTSLLSLMLKCIQHYEFWKKPSENVTFQNHRIWCNGTKGVSPHLRIDLYYWAKTLRVANPTGIAYLRRLLLCCRHQESVVASHHRLKKCTILETIFYLRKRISSRTRTASALFDLCRAFSPTKVLAVFIYLGIVPAYECSISTPS